MSGGPEVRPSVRQQLVDKLAEHGWGRAAQADIADALLPVVDRFAAERAAEAFRRHRIGRVRQAALVLSDAELNDALELWYRQRETT